MFSDAFGEYFIRLFQLVNGANDLEDPLPPKTQGTTSCNYWEESFLCISCETQPLKIVILAKCFIKYAKKNLYRTFTHWPAPSSLRLLENFYKQSYSGDFSLFITCRGEGEGAGVKGFADKGLCWSHDNPIPPRAVPYNFMIPISPLSFPVHWNSILYSLLPSCSVGEDWFSSISPEKLFDPPKFSTYQAVNNDKTLS